MKRTLLFVAIMMACFVSFSQDMAKFHLYHPEAKAEQEIKEAVKQAKETGKNVLIQIGGNWCIWCARFNDFTTTDHTIDSTIRANFIVYHLNWSKENKNEEVLTKY